jgi:hypothetical protein
MVIWALECLINRSFNKAIHFHDFILVFQTIGIAGIMCAKRRPKGNYRSKYRLNGTRILCIAFCFCRGSRTIINPL